MEFCIYSHKQPIHYKKKKNEIVYCANRLNKHLLRSNVKMKVDFLQSVPVRCHDKQFNFFFNEFINEMSFR